MTQNDRVLAFIRANPGATALDIAHGTTPWVSNPRARISDLRKLGHVIDCTKDGGTGRFYLREAPVQGVLAL